MPMHVGEIVLGYSMQLMLIPLLLLRLAILIASDLVRPVVAIRIVDHIKATRMLETVVTGALLLF